MPCPDTSGSACGVFLGGGSMTPDFIGWLERTQAQRDSLTVYGQTGKPPTEEGRALDSLVAIKMSDEAARLLAEAEMHLTHEQEAAMWDTKRRYPDLNSRERELIEKSEVREVQLIVEAAKITYKSCVSRYFNYKGK